MNLKTRLVKTKLALRNLADYLGNGSKTYRLMGYGRYDFYQIKALFVIGGEPDLLKISHSTIAKTG